MDSVDYPLYMPAIEDRTSRAFRMNTFRAAVGPGWYESSRDLMRGLTVLEGPLAELALTDWLKVSQNGR